MRTSKCFINKSLKFGSAGLGLLAILLANNAKAQSEYFDVNGTTAGYGVVNGATYSWDGPNWATTSGGAAATSFWTGGGFARLYGAASYTVTVNADESMAGMYLNGGAVTVNINDAGNNTGTLDITPGTALTQNGFSWLPQGFLTGGGTLNINAPISGVGGIEEESGGGALALLGNNTYTGGTLFISSSTLVNYNNNNSFGDPSSQIGYDNTTFSIMNNTGPAGVNIANPVQILGGTTGVDFIGNSATMSGNWNLAGYTVNIRNNGVGTTETLSGVLSGTALPVTFSGANGGTILLSGVNTYTGSTTIGSTGDTAVTLQLGVANAISHSSSLILAGGKFNPGGFNQAMPTTTLGMTASSTIDFGAGASAVSFADSSLLAWTGTLNLANWNGAIDSLQFGTGTPGLTAAQLGDIEFGGNAATLGTAAFGANGTLIETPEPSTICLLVGGLGVLCSYRRRKA
jgi:hypothetical protein